jgi:hypothetical protein
MISRDIEKSQDFRTSFALFIILKNIYLDTCSWLFPGQDVFKISFHFICRPQTWLNNMNIIFVLDSI